MIILTPASLASQWVTYEWAYASFLGKVILPIKLVKFADERIHDKLRVLQYQDFTDHETHVNEWIKLSKTLIQFTKKNINLIR